MSSKEKIGDASIYWRPLRQLIGFGKPLPTTTTVAFAPTEHGPVPFGAFARTKKDRLIFWPVLPNDVKLYKDDGQPLVVDHLTLEFPSGKIHSTSIGRDGRHKHLSHGWRLHRFPDKGIALWFMLFVPWSALCNQDLLVEQQVSTPKSDKVRRENEFRKHARSLRSEGIPLPPKGREGDYVWCVCYVLADDRTDVDITREVLPCGPYLDRWIDGFPAGTRFDAQPRIVEIGESRLMLIAICPPGRLKEDAIAFGLPQSPRSISRATSRET